MAAVGAKQSTLTTSDALRQQRLDVQLRQLEFNNLLHRKLDLERLFECLLSEGQAFVKFDGLQFVAADRGVDLTLGFTRQQRQRFELKLGERSLGDIVLMRARAFSARDERDAERLVESLIYPLDNALEYHDALMKAMTDTVTGLRNQRALNELLPREIRLVRRVEQPLAAILLSVDHLDAINKDHGASAGELAWRTVAESLEKRLRQSDLIFRTEGDLFCIILNQTDLDGALILAERLRKAVDHCVSLGNVQFVLSACAGVSELSAEDDAQSLLSRTGEALQRAKRAGANQVCAIAVESPGSDNDPDVA